MIYACFNNEIQNQDNSMFRHMLKKLMVLKGGSVFFTFQQS